MPRSIRIGRRSMFETMMLGLRLVDGVDTDAFCARYGARAGEVFAGTAISERLARSEMIRMEKGRLKPTGKGAGFSHPRGVGISGK